MLTHMQAQLLQFIKDYTESNCGVSPTFDEMRQELGLASKSGVARLVDALVERGFIQRLKNRARALTVVDAPTPILDLSMYRSDQLISELARRSNRKRGEV